MAVHRKVSINLMFLTYLILVAVISISSVGYLWLSSAKARFENESIALREKYEEEQKKIIKREVGHAITFIQHMQSQTEYRLKESVRQRVYEAHAIAENIYREHSASKEMGEIKRIVKDALRPIRFNKGRGYYFAFDLNGIEELFADKPEMEGVNMLPVQGGKGEFVVADMLKLVAKNQEGFYEYTWSKPEREGIYPKIAFVKLIEPLGWVVGTGEYLDDVEHDIQQEVLRWLSNIKFGADGYLFAGNWDGLSLSGPAAGKNMYDATDINGIKIVQRLIEAAKSGGGFVRYVLPKFEGKKHAPKISYAAGVPKWEWYIGSGLYVDEIDEVIANNQAELRERIFTQFRNTIILFLGVILSICLLVRFIAVRMRRNLDSFGLFFDETAAGEARIDEKALHFSEFKDLAKRANKMTAERKLAEETLMLFKSAVANSSDAIGMSSPEGRHWYQNRAFDLLFGDIGTDPPARVYADEAEGREVFQTIMAGDSWIGEVEMNAKDGRKRQILLRAYAVKDREGRVTNLVGVHTDITNRKHVEGNLIKSEQRFRELAELLPQIVFETTPQGELTFVNRIAYKTFGYTEEDFKRGLNAMDMIIPEEREQALANIVQLLAGDPVKVGLKYTAIRKDGSRFPILIYASVILEDTEAVGLRGIIVDMTEQEKLIEERDQFRGQYIQAQKIEAIGRLAGGVAHDLNNMLAPILGYGELLLSSLSADDRKRRPIEEILNAGMRARNMVHQLLAFSRKQALEIRTVNLNLIVKVFRELLHRMLREDVHLELNLAKDLPDIQADAGQIEQVVMNLAINAQDAMPGGGLLKLTTEAVDLDDHEAARHQGLVAGTFVRLTVRDTGHGMDTKTRERIFEPFFTTKGQGKGTGLGLATVYGIIKQHKGGIEVSSRPGEGTVFELYFPVVTETAEEEAAAVEEDGSFRGDESIMIVEDNTAVRRLAKNILARQGYRLSTAPSGAACLELLAGLATPPDLLLTDVIMPDTNGRELYEQVKARYPAIKVLYMSGYTDDVIVHHGVLEEEINFIQKPFSVRDLLAQVRKVLDEEA